MELGSFVCVCVLSLMLWSKENRDDGLKNVK